MDHATSFSTTCSSLHHPSHHQNDKNGEEEHHQLLGLHADYVDDEYGECGDGKNLEGTLRAVPRDDSTRGLLVCRLTHERLMRGMAFILLVSLVACLALFGMIASSTRRPDASTDFRRTDADYILDPDWNFDAPPTTREYNWEIADVNANPDGVYRPMMAINGKFPGPTVEANQGDTVRFNVANRAENSTSIHFHGLFQNGTAWMDGTPGVTQCPIPPGHSFSYEFVLGQSGTYMYHAHHGAQALDGLFGPFIIHSPSEKHRGYGTDRVIMVQDWYHDLSDGLMLKKLSPGSESSPVPDSSLINGRNTVRCENFPGRLCDTTHSYLPTIDLPMGTPHRLRIIHTGGFAWFDVSIDGHANMVDLVEVDGVSIQPTREQKIVLGPGQRYSIVVQQPPASGHRDKFWLRARMIKECFAEPATGFRDAMAHLLYRDPNIPTVRSRRGDTETKVPLEGPDMQPIAERATECKDMKSSAYRPTPERDAPQIADHSWNIRVNMGIGDWRLERGYINGSSFRSQVGAPTLHRFVDGLRSGNGSFFIAGVNDKAFYLPHELVISQKSIEVVDLVILNLDEGNHPFHLHGYQMFVLAQGHGYFPGYESLGLAPHGKGLLAETDAKTSILKNPVRRDTATVEGFGWLLVRFIADNPGVWYFHCHIAWHEGGGMGMQFASRLDVMKEWTIPKANLDLCSVGVAELSKGVPPEDSFWEGTGL